MDLPTVSLLLLAGLVAGRNFKLAGLVTLSAVVVGGICLVYLFAAKGAGPSPFFLMGSAALLQVGYLLGLVLPFRFDALVSRALWTARRLIARK